MSDIYEAMLKALESIKIGYAIEPPREIMHPRQYTLRKQWERGWWKADEDSPMKVYIDSWEQKVIMTDRHPAYGTDEDPLGKRYWYDRI